MALDLFPPRVAIGTFMLGGKSVSVMASADFLRALRQLLDRVGGAVAPSIPDLVVGPPVATNNAVVLFDGSTGKLVKDSSKTISTDGTLAANSDAFLSTQKAVKTYVDATTASVAGAAARYSRSFLLMGG